MNFKIPYLVPKFFSFTVLVLVLTACGKTADAPAESGTNQAAPAGNNHRATYSINTRWKTTSQSCSGQNQTIDPSVSYRFDETYLARIELLSEDADSLCRTATLSTRIVTHSTSTGSESGGAGTETEQGTLQATSAKNVCYAKISGQVTDKVLSSTRFDPPASIAGYKLEFSGVRATLSLEKSANCLGLTVIELNQI